MRSPDSQRFYSRSQSTPVVNSRPISGLQKGLLFARREGTRGLFSALRLRRRRRKSKTGDQVRSTERGRTHSTSVSDDESYPSFCESAAADPSVFATFRSDPRYTPILENLAIVHGRTCLDQIFQDPVVSAAVPASVRGDTLGGPLQFRYKGIGHVSPTTLRYLKVVADLRRHFGDLSELRIVEIGIGYGGQCRALMSIAAIQSFDGIDLPEVILLAERFLRASGVDMRRVTLTNGRAPRSVSGDLFISNYAFSELHREAQELYMENVVQNCPRGYVTYNPIAQDSTGAMTAAEFASRIPNSRTFDEFPLTHPGNKVIVWGS
jgi:hypothetical protein